jgi:hypothetical protein
MHPGAWGAFGRPLIACGAAKAEPIGQRMLDARIIGHADAGEPAIRMPD